MAEIKYRDSKNYLAAMTPEDVLPVYLIHGEEFFYKSVFRTLLSALLPDPEKSLNFEQIDGADGSVFDITDSLQTFSLLSDRKVVAFCDTKIFYSKEDEKKLLEKIRTEFEKDNHKKAAKTFVSLLSILNLSFDHLEGENRYQALKIVPGSEHGKWIDPIIQYCLQQNLSIPPAQDQARILQHAIEKGFPNNNVLIITADTIDKRKGLYKIIKKIGMVIDCGVPAGNRMADKREKEALLKERMGEVLSKNGKTLAHGTYQAMIDYSGFSFRTFIQNLEKLVTYAGDEKTITMDSVHAVLHRTRQDPVFELTGAVSDRDVEKSLFFLESLLSDGMFPLQILAALTNHIRKLLVAKDFLAGALGRSWHGGMSFNQFKTSVMPDAINYDNELIGQVEETERIRAGGQAETPKKGKRKIKSDLLIAANPNNAYPVYQLLLKSGKFKHVELIDALETLGQADLRLKTTAITPVLILEQSIIKICKTA